MYQYLHIVLACLICYISSVLVTNSLNNADVPLSNKKMFTFIMKFILLQVAKAHPNDKDARAKFTECNKIVKRIAFEKAISIDEAKKSVVDQINLDSMSKMQSIFYDIVAFVLVIQQLLRCCHYQLLNVLHYSFRASKLVQLAVSPRYTSYSCHINIVIYFHSLLYRHILILQSKTSSFILLELR